jgi:hypothetical protein
LDVRWGLGPTSGEILKLLGYNERMVGKIDRGLTAKVIGSCGRTGGQNEPRLNIEQ